MDPFPTRVGWAWHLDTLLVEIPLTLHGFIVSMTVNLCHQFGTLSMRSMLQNHLTLFSHHVTKTSYLLHQISRKIKSEFWQLCWCHWWHACLDSQANKVGCQATGIWWDEVLLQSKKEVRAEYVSDLRFNGTASWYRDSFSWCILGLLCLQLLKD